MAFITYADKVAAQPVGTPVEEYWQASNANEIKSVVNANRFTDKIVQIGQIEPDLAGNWQLVSNAAETGFEIGTIATTSSGITIDFSTSIAAFKGVHAIAHGIGLITAVPFSAVVNTAANTLVLTPTLGGMKVNNFRVLFNGSSWSMNPIYSNPSVSPSGSAASLTLSFGTVGNATIGSPVVDFNYYGPVATWGTIAARITNMNFSSVTLTFYDMTTGLAANAPSGVEIVGNRYSFLDPNIKDFDPSGSVAQNANNRISLFATVSQT